MYKALLDTLEKAGIKLPSWILITIAIIICCALIVLISKKYIIPFIKRTKNTRDFIVMRWIGVNSKIARKLVVDGLNSHRTVNCWKILKTNKLKRKDEIYLNVYVTKVEKIVSMIYGVNLTIVYKMDNQQLSSE